MENSYYNITGRFSQSILKVLKDDPLKAKELLEGIKEDEKAKYLDFGTQVHMKLLEPKKFEDEIAHREFQMPNSQSKIKFCQSLNEGMELIEAYKSAYTTKEKDDKILEKAKKLETECLEYINHLKEGHNKTFLATSTYEKIATIEKNVKEHKKAAILMYGDPIEVLTDEIESYNEYPIMWECEGVLCKSLLDRVTVNKTTKHITLVDVKTTSSMTNFNDSFIKYGYAFQLAFYSMAIRYCKELTGIKEDAELDDWTIDFYIVAIDTINCSVKVFSITEGTIAKEFPSIKSLLQRANWHVTNNEWAHSMEYHMSDGVEELQC